MYIYEDEALKSVAHIKHGFFGRQGGVSEGLYKSLNVGFSTKDTEENIVHNRAVIRRALDSNGVITVNQVHGADIVNVGSLTVQDASAPQADGMVTQHEKIALGILTADCVPILAVDRHKKIAGAAHSGWGGAFKGIGQHLIKRMIANGAVEKDIIIALGPCIQQKSYEVDESFYQRFIEQSEGNRAFFKEGDRDGHYLFNLPSYISRQIQKDYPRLYAVSVCDEDTYSQSNLFFSYRRSCHNSEDDYGRQISAISLI